MKRIVFFISILALAIFITVNLHAAEKKWKKVVVAVPEAEVFFKEGVDANYASIITDKLISAFESSGKIETKNDNDIEEIMKTMKEAQLFTGEGTCKTDDKCMVRIAQKMNVSYVAKLKVIENDSQFSVTLRMIKIKADDDIEQITRDVDSKREIADLVMTVGKQMAIAFPALEAKITSVDEDSVYINYGSTSGLKKNFQMIVKRKVVKTDNQGNVIHETFQEIGKIVLDDVSANTSQGKVKKGKGFQVGDSVFVDDEQIRKEMEEKDLAKKKEEETRKKNELKAKQDEDTNKYISNLDAEKERKIQERKLSTYLYLRCGGGVAEMDDADLKEYYGSGSLGMAEAVIGSNTFGLFGRFTYRSFELQDDYILQGAFINCEEDKVEIISGDIGMRLYIGPEFYWIMTKLYISAAARYNIYTEKATLNTGNEIEYEFTGWGWVAGAGVELTLFNTLGVFAEYDLGSWKIGETEERQIEGKQVLFGATLKI